MAGTQTPHAGIHIRRCSCLRVIRQQGVYVNGLRVDGWLRLLGLDEEADVDGDASGLGLAAVAGADLGLDDGTDAGAVEGVSDALSGDFGIVGLMGELFEAVDHGVHHRSETALGFGLDLGGGPTVEAADGATADAGLLALLPGAFGVGAAARGDGLDRLEVGLGAHCGVCPVTVTPSSVVLGGWTVRLVVRV